jgi:hypothetical protein
MNLATTEVPIMPVGAKPGQIILLVDLSLTSDPGNAIEILKERGYRPTLYSCAFKTGERLVAVLKDEQFNPALEIDDEYLMDEWMLLRDAINPDAVRLWRGHPKKMAIAA